MEIFHRFFLFPVPARLLLTENAAGDILIKNELLRPPAASSSPDGRAFGKPRKDKPDEKGEEIEMIVETSRFILFDRLFIRMADSRFGKNIITYDENRDPETYVFDKLNDGLFKVKSIYFDDLDFELEDYLFEVSEHYLCQSFSAMEFRERIKSANSPYHDWYNAIADDDNPVLVLGKVRN